MPVAWLHFSGCLVECRFHLIASQARRVLHARNLYSVTASMSAITIDSANDADPAAEPAPTPTQVASRPCSLSEAVAAVTEHNLRTEMRRVTLAYASSKAQRRYRHPAAGRVLTTCASACAKPALLHALGGALQLVGFDAAPPHVVCESPPPDQAMPDIPACGQPFTQCFVPSDAQRVQQALLALDSHFTMTVELRHSRCLVSAICCTCWPPIRQRPTSAGPPCRPCRSIARTQGIGPAQAD